MADTPPATESGVVRAARIAALAEREVDLKLQLRQAKRRHAFTVSEARSNEQYLVEPLESDLAFVTAELEALDA